MKNRTLGLLFLLFSLLAFSAFAYDQAHLQNDMAVANQLIEKVPLTDWLGPLAPIALSPFFGLACLSGLSLLVQKGAIPGNALLESNTVLAEPTVFIVFAALAILTALPKLSKVSKPLGQLADRAEMYAGLISLFIIKSFGASELVGGEASLMMAGMPAEVLLMIAAGLNVFVIHTVKFFFEFLMWITPIPLLDALFEAGNKAVCLGLMTLYAFSPMLATGVNLLIFLVCLIIFRTAWRRMIYYRSMLVMPLLQKIVGKGAKAIPPLTVFPASKIENIPARAKCKLRCDEQGWTLTTLGGRHRVQWTFSDFQAVLNKGWIKHRIELTAQTGGEPVKLDFSRSYGSQIDQILQTYQAELHESDLQTDDSLKDALA